MNKEDLILKNAYVLSVHWLRGLLGNRGVNTPNFLLALWLIRSWGGTLMVVGSSPAEGNKL